jgi:hypothetical protein
MVWDRRATSRQSASKVYLDSIDASEVPWGCALKIDRAINPQNDAYVRALRYCRDQRGLLGVLSSAGELQVLRTNREYFEPSRENDVEGSPELLQVTKSHVLMHPSFDDNFSYSQNERVVSFDWITPGYKDTQQRVVTRKFNQKLEVMMLPWKKLTPSLEFLQIPGKRRCL